jgi:hypothetical protein
MYAIIQVVMSSHPLLSIFHKTEEHDIGTSGPLRYRSRMCFMEPFEWAAIQYVPKLLSPSTLFD